MFVFKKVNERYIQITLRRVQLIILQILYSNHVKSAKIKTSKQRTRIER